MFSLPKGFRLATAQAGFRKEHRDDLALVVSDRPAAAAATFTRNRFPAAPVLVGKDLLSNTPQAQAIVINSGQANACTGDTGLANCRTTQRLLADALNTHGVTVRPDAILPASTGVIGDQLRMDRWEAAVPTLAANLGKASVEDFARAIMTTDAFPKMAQRDVTLGTGTIHLVGMAKGAGMICPNMATMLAVVLCDADISPADWSHLVQQAVAQTFNRVTVDGDTSTNDTLYALANGASEVAVSTPDALHDLQSALTSVLADLAYMLVQDGEGSSKVAHIHVHGAVSDRDAEQVARTVGHSQLVKTALYGRDANWGRIIGAIGRSEATFTPEAVAVSLCGVPLFANGQPTPTAGTPETEAVLSEALQQRDISIDIVLGEGSGSYTLLASDLGHEYVDCNASYRS